MSWSWKLGRIAGIPIYIHWTFLVLIGWIVISHRVEGDDVATTVEGVAFVLTLFGCVVLHELGHALAARRYGVPTTDITLLPIGGIARLQRIPEKPSQEFAIAIAGPLVNLVIVASLFIAGVRTNGEIGDPRFLVDSAYLPRLMLVNIFLAAFNLLPAFPMDGGRILRALLAMRLDYARATRIAATIGQVMAVGFGILGLATGNPMLVIIAAFVWLGAASEAYHVEERLLLRNVHVREAMITDFETLQTHDSLGNAADLLLAGSQHDFPAVSGKSIIGFLTRQDLVAGLARAGRDAKVAEFCRRKIPKVDAGSMLVTALDRLRQGDVPCLEVMDGNTEVGLLTLNQIQNFLMVRSAESAGRFGGTRVTPYNQPNATPTHVAAS